MKLLMTACFVVFALAARAEDILEKSLSGSSKAANPVDARREIQDQVSQQVTEDLARELLGDERFQKNKTLIMNKIVKSSGRFIPFLKPGTLTSAPDGGFTMSVTLKANVSALRQVLQENGLLNENTTTPVILPLVTFIDKANAQSDRWWLTGERGSKTFLRTLGRQFEASLREAFRKGGFFVLRPQTNSLTPSVPKGLRAESPGPEDQGLLGDWFGAPLVIGGTVTVQKQNGGARIDVKLDVLQTANNRPIADVSRIYATEAGTFETVTERKWREVSEGLATDLASQVVEAWQKGSIGSSQLRLVLEPRPGLQEIEALKEKLKSSSAGIRSLHERLVSSNTLVLEVDSPVGASDLAARLKGFEFGGRTFDTSVENEKSVHVKWGKGGGTP